MLFGCTYITGIELPGDGVTGPSGARARDLSGVDEVSPLNPFNASVERFFFNCYNIRQHNNQILKSCNLQS
jgi:hypothetical protein